MASIDNLTEEEKEFLSKCEEELKDRYTDDDAEFMKVFSSDLSEPPIIESWWQPKSRRGEDSNDYDNRRRDHRHPERSNHYYDRRYNDNRKRHRPY